MFSIGFCSWDLPAFLLLAVILSVYILRRQRLKRHRQTLEKKLARKPPKQETKDSMNKD